MRSWIVGGAIVSVAVAASLVARSACQGPPVRSLDRQALTEYVGIYQQAPNAFLYLQVWNEITGRDQLVAHDDSGELRALYATDRDRFFAGSGVGVANEIESRVEFQRDGNGRISALTWQRGDAAPRAAKRVDLERREDVQFPSGGIRLAGTLIAPARSGKHPAVILVHGSGAQNRDAILPFARFLIPRGMAVLGYDKRGVGGSSGDWNTASFDDLAADVVAAFEYLKTRPDIDAQQIGMLGWSQAGWVMPIAAVRASSMAFLISVSGAAVPASETALDHARNEMATNTPPKVAAQILELMKLQYEYARTGDGWDRYADARQALVARMPGPPPDNFPATPNGAYWDFIRPLSRYDPGPTLRQLQVPTLAIFGELDNNILAEKNRAAWEAALTAGRHPDYTLRIMPRANHAQLEAKAGNNAEMPSLQRFVPEYSATVQEWLRKRVRGFGG
jgi:dienelactone hydrolase